MRHIVTSTPTTRPRAGLRPATAWLLTGLFAAALSAGCSSDDGSPVATPDMADVNTYVGGLNSWPAPLQITIDLLGAGTTRTVDSPDLASVNEALGELITLAENSGQTFSSDILFNQTTVSAYFLQKMFTTSMTLPQLPSDLFSDAFTEERLAEQVALDRIGPDNQPAYISSIVWGRLMMLTITSTSSETDIKAAISASYDGAVASGSGSVDAASLRLLNEASIQLVTLGGDQSAALGYLRSGTLADFFAEDAPLTTAVPLSFTVRDMQTNEKALVSETTSYNVKTCSSVAPDAIGARYRVRLDNLVFTDADCDGFADTDVEAFWDIRANEVSAARLEDDYYPFSYGSYEPIRTDWAEADILFDGTGRITIVGTVSDYDDLSANDVIGSWDMVYDTVNIEVGSYSVSGGVPDGPECRVVLDFTIEKVADVRGAP